MIVYLSYISQYRKPRLRVVVWREGEGGKKGVANKILFRHLVVESYHAPCLTFYLE